MGFSYTMAKVTMKNDVAVCLCEDDGTTTREVNKLFVEIIARHELSGNMS